MFLYHHLVSFGNPTTSHRRYSVRKGVLRNFARFTGKYLWQGLFFNKVVGIIRPRTFKRDTAAQVFSVNLAKFLRTPPKDCFCNSPFTTTYAAIARGSRPLVFCKGGGGVRSYRFRKMELHI